MNKSPLVVMAILCTLLIACEKEATITNSDYDQLIQKRSSNSITVEYTTVEQSTTTVNCTKVEIDYFDDASALIHFTFYDNTTLNVYGDSVIVTTYPEYILDVTIDESNFEVDDISISVDGDFLSYADSTESIVGTGLSIIIEDEPDGF